MASMTTEGRWNLLASFGTGRVSYLHPTHQVLLDEPNRSPLFVIY